MFNYLKRYRVLLSITICWGVIVCLIALIENVKACNCNSIYTVKEAYKKSKAIFSGKVIAIEPFSTQQNGIELFLVKFEVDKVWKGFSNSQVQVVVYPSSSSCAYPFTKDEKYLVYCLIGEYSSLTTNICTRTKSLALVNEDFKFLRHKKYLQFNKK